MEEKIQIVILTVNGKIIEAQKGRRLSEYLSMDMPCGAHGKCGKCKVVADGALSALTDTEREHLSTQEIESGVRLACVTYIEGDCTVVTDTSEKDAKILLDGDMPPISIMPSFSGYGAAVDIGTTTLAARLYSASGELLAQASMLNPQSAWGADVVSRMEAAVAGEADSQQRAICEAVDSLMVTLAKNAKICAELIDGMVITGNTVMLHLLTGTSVEPLTHAPFAVERLFGETLDAAKLGFSHVCPYATVYIPPCIAAFVGADTVCAILSTELCEKNTARLMVDIGTNGEIALWSGNKLAVCSTAAGPAFEGVGISCGMRGETGAVDKVQIEDGALAARVIGGKDAKGICGSGLVDAIACLLESEALDETGYLEEEHVEICSGVELTQSDVRMVQLAKSAICAGIRALMKASGVDAASTMEMLIAGGFGNYLDINNSARIGLIPAELAERVKVVGNAALSGASMLLLDKRLADKCTQIASDAYSHELSTDAVFAEHYMMGMMFGE